MKNVCMASNLEDLDRTTEIAPDGGSGINEGIRRDLKGFGNHLTTTVEERLIHDITEETN